MNTTLSKKLENETWVLVADGAKALTLVNEGDGDIINLRRVTVEEGHHARTSDLEATGRARLTRRAPTARCEAPPSKPTGTRRPNGNSSAAPPAIVTPQRARASSGSS